MPYRALDRKKANGLPVEKLLLIPTLSLIKSSVSKYIVPLFGAIDNTAVARSITMR